MTLAEIEIQLAAWQEALLKCSSGQSYVVGGVRNGRSLTRADLPEIRATIDWLDVKKTQAQQGGQIRVRRVTL